jgi:N-formylglutamate amidohydrolase
MPDSAPSFLRHGPALPVSPVVVSVPHGGRDYPAALLAMAQVPVAGMRVLEDRHIDTLALAARGAETTLVQGRARAWIDLNRAEHERDPLIDAGAAPLGRGAPATKVRSGLGLIPRRAAPGLDLWRRKLGDAEVLARIAADHRPFHHALAEALAAAHARFGVAVLLDIHSMPPIAGPGAARLVFGDRFGRSAAARFAARLEAEARDDGLNAALNIPYAGAHILERHGRPAMGVHAVQVEIDRSLYLDAALDAPGPGFAATARLLRRLIDAAAEVASGTSALAAE